MAESRSSSGRLVNQGMGFETERGYHVRNQDSGRFPDVW